MTLIDPVVFTSPTPVKDPGTFRWATVTDVDPLAIRLDGDVDPLPLVPDSLVHPVAVGQRVWVQLFHRRIIVLGVAQVPAVPVSQGWIAATLLGTWVNYGSMWPEAGYRMGRDRRVYLRGLVKGGGIGVDNPIFVLPEGYRPEGTPTSGEMFDVPASLTGGHGSARLDVKGDGEVQVIAYSASATNAYVSLSGVSFYPAGT